MSEKHPAGDASKKDPERHSYTVKTPFINKGVELKEGEKVKLRHDQAERLKASGHI